MMKKYIDNLAAEAIQSENTPCFPGLYYGKMGCAVFLFLYASYSQDKIYQEHAFNLIAEANSHLHANSPVNYPYGLSGMGTAFAYLIQNDYIKADANKVLNNYDMKLIKSLKDNGMLSSDRQIFDIGKYLSTRLKQTDANHQLKDNIELIVKLIEMILLRGSSNIQEAYKILSALNSDLVNTNKQIKEKIALWIEYAKKDNALEWQYISSITKNIFPILLEENEIIDNEIDIMNASIHELMKHIMLSVLLNKKLDDAIIPKLLEKATVSEMSFLNGKIGVGLTLLSLLDKKYATWYELIG